MAQPYIGQTTGIGLEEEAAYGDGVTTSTNFLPVTSFSMRRHRTRVIIPELAQGSAYDARREAVALSDTTGDLEFLARYDGIGRVIKAALGGMADAGAGPYTHTATMGATLPSLAIEGYLGTSGKSEEFAGCMVSKLGLSMRAGGNDPFLRAKLSILGKTSAARNTAATPTYTTAERVLNRHCGTLTFNAVQHTLASWDLTIDNKLVRVDDLGSLETAQPVVGNVREVRLKVTLNARSATVLLAAHHADTSSNVTWSCTGTGNNAIAFSLYNGTIWDYSDPVQSHGIWTQSVEFLGKADGSNGSLGIVTTNDSALYSAA